MCVRISSGKSLSQGGLSCILIQLICVFKLFFSSSCVCISSGKSLGQEGLPCFFKCTFVFIFLSVPYLLFVFFCTFVCVCISSS